MARTGENIYKRKDGRWEARFIVFYGENGKAKYRYLYAKTYSDVKNRLRKALSEKPPASDTGIRDKDETYGYWLDKWLYAKKTQVRESTYIRYLNMVSNHIKPRLGKYPIDKIGTALMEQFVRDKTERGRLDGKGGLSTKSVSDILTVIKETFRYARSRDATPICEFNWPAFKRSSRNARVLSVSEEKQLLSVLFKEPDRYKVGVFLCLYTGMRIGELCALKCKDISLNEKTVKIEHTMQRVQSGDGGTTKRTRIIVTRPKSSAGTRTIPLPDFVAEMIKPFIGSPNSYFLSGKGGHGVEPRTMQNKFKSYLAEGVIEDANFHALRHTFATRCVEAGFDVKTLSEILGHSSVRITLDKYVHSSMELKRSNMDKLNLLGL